MIGEGKYKARATGRVVIGDSAKAKTPFIECYFVVTEGAAIGEEIRWTGYFSDAKCGKVSLAERIMSSLRFCGWSGDDPGEFVDGELHGLDSNEVEIDVGIEEYEVDGEQRSMSRVQWVNKIGGFLNIDNAMSKERAASFGERMKGLALKTKAKLSSSSSDSGTEFNHGANAPPPEAKAGGARKGW